MNERPLRILQVSTAARAGGAEGSAWNLFQTYRLRGYGSWLAVGYKETDDPDVILIPRNTRQRRYSDFVRSWRGRLKRYEEDVRGGWRVGARLDTWANWLDTGPSARRAVERHLGIEDFNYPGTGHLLRLTPHRPDIIHCHNLHGSYFDLRTLPWLSRQAPLILNLRDAWMLSGHCGHSFDCERWKIGCGRCPDLNIFPAINRDATAYNWRRKQKIYSKSKFYVTTPCEWLMRKVEQSILAPAMREARVIPNGVDLSVFRPGSKQAARAELGIPNGVKVLLSTAHGIRRNPWKDYEGMRAAVGEVAGGKGGQGLLFIALGERAPAERIGQAEVRFVPFEKSRAVVAAYYRAADVYMHGARVDTFPNTVLEALACGTPVVATAVGGIPEQVKGLKSASGADQMVELNRYGENEATGILVAAGDPRGMALGVERLLSDESLCRLIGENGAEDARKRFDLQRQADDFLKWYEQIVQRANARPDTKGAA